MGVYMMKEIKKFLNFLYYIDNIRLAWCLTN